MEKNKHGKPCRDVTDEFNKAVQYHRAGQLNMAEKGYRNILGIMPDHDRAIHSLGIIAYQSGRYDIAADLIGRAIHINPQEPVYYNSIGNALAMLGKYNEAISAFGNALLLKPDYAEACYNLGRALEEKGNLDEAAQCYQKALLLKPDYAEACYNLGRALEEKGNLDEAAQCYQRAAQLKPDYAEAINNLGRILNYQGKYEEALQCYRKAIEIKPGLPYLYSNYLMTIHYDAGFTRQMLYQAAIQWDEKYCRSLYREKGFHNDPDPDRKLKVGYVSADFCRHPVGFFIDAVLTYHNREVFEVYCYDNGSKPDDMTHRFQYLPLRWKSIANISDESAEQMIVEDCIDILVDLSGHSAKNRLLLFARKPAPVQAAWIGYFDTTGMKAMDYIIADKYIIPEADERYYVEKVARLPHSYLCYTPREYAPPVNEPPFLSKGYITFGCFNNIIKITPEVAATWSKRL